MKLKIYADPFSVSGYSLHAREMILAFLNDKWNIKLAHSMMDVYQNDSFPGAASIRQIMENTPDPHGDMSLQIMLPIYWNTNSKYNIGMFFYEADKLPKQWADMCNKMTGIIVPSEFCKKVCLDSGVTVPVKVAHGYYLHQLSGEKLDWKEMLGIKDEKVFLSVLQWNYRKGFDALLRAYWSAFSDKDNVRLVIKTYVQSFSEKENAHIVNEINSLKKMHLIYENGVAYLPNFPKITLLTTSLTDNEMYWLYEACDAFVLLSRGEGWGRPYLEAMAHGKPIVATNWSSHTEFLNENNSYLVNAVLEPCLGVNGAFYPITSNIATPDISQAAKYMKEIYALPAGEIRKPIYGSVDQFNEKRSVQEYKDAIMEIVNGN